MSQQWTATETEALGAADLGVAESLFKEVTINPTIELPELTQTFGEYKQKLVLHDPGERSSDPTRDSPRPAYECPGVSRGGMGRWWPAAGFGALSVAVHAWDHLKEVTIIFITTTIVWPQVDNREGTQLHPSTKN